ncbi:MAG: AmmeMemoRadiSam system radical SAM enzyme [Candidatus Omnitrophica bacterium]|nr:AmmeMemoRadiSam system radical SAM enzyme [Candidatus Omnitrophota bacterium]
MMKEAMLYEKLKGKKVHCYLCNHHCKIADSQFGFCGVRENREGKLYTHVFGEVIASHVDPIEKKPLYHFFPGTRSYSIATVGCNFRCGFCQNWQISQSNKRVAPDMSGYELKPEEVVREAKKGGCRGISYTYTEPTIFFEYAYETARIAKKEGLYNSFVTNGFMTEEALGTIKPYLDACNVDLKSFREDFYKDICKAALEPVLESIKIMKRLGIWVEITTLVLPGKNDSDEELRDIAGFIAGVDIDIPWHISRFHPDYEYARSEPTPLKTLKRAEAIGREAGLRYIYIGNVLGESDNTMCYNCSALLIKRSGFAAENAGLKDSKCSKCGAVIKGLF